MILNQTQSVWVNVSLQRPPPSTRSVYVTIDTSAGTGAFLVSACSLMFTALNWFIPQSVYFTPMIGNSVDKTAKVGGVASAVPSLCARLSVWATATRVRVSTLALVLVSRS